MNSDASRIAALVGPVLLCLALTFGVVVTLAGKSDAASMEYTITQLNRPGELMYSIGNLLSSEDGALGNFENAKWTAISEFSYKYLIGRREVWYRMPLQLVRSEEPAILLSTR